MRHYFTGLPAAAGRAELGATVVAVDRDPSAIAAAEKLQLEPGNGGRLYPVLGCFSQLSQLLTNSAKLRSLPIHGVVFDIGLCSAQVQPRLPQYTSIFLTRSHTLSDDHNASFAWVHVAG